MCQWMDGLQAMGKNSTTMGTSGLTSQVSPADLCNYTCQLVDRLKCEPLALRILLHPQGEIFKWWGFKNLCADFKLWCMCPHTAVFKYYIQRFLGISTKISWKGGINTIQSIHASSVLPRIYIGDPWGGFQEREKSSRKATTSQRLQESTLI